MTPVAFSERLRACGPGLTMRENEPLSRHTTLQVGGPADWLVDVRGADELACVLRETATASVPLTLLGGGSNVVVSDEGLRGVVIRLRLTALSQPAADVVRAEAGVTMNGLVRWMIGRGLAGLEAWAGTPGTVGGAIFGNAHYAGRNIGDCVREARVVDRDGRPATIPREDMAFGYDTSRLQTSGEILVSADFEVRPGDAARLRAVARASLAHRKRTQPLALPSAGCIFQNPDPARDRLPAGVPASAGALVDRAGFKGRRVGGAIVSGIHANFVVNDGHATARDIHRLTEEARQAVRDRFGVDLRNEVVFLGHF